MIHTVGPVWQGGGAGEAELLASCYRASLGIAAAAAAKTVAFPAISCGVYGYPLDLAARIAVREIAEFLSSDERIEKVVLAVFGGDVEQAERAVYEERFGAD